MASNALGFQVLDKRVKPGVFGHNVEIESVATCALDAHVFGVQPKGLEFSSEVEWNLCLVGTAKDFGFQRTSAEGSQVLRLNVLEVDEDNAGFQIDGGSVRSGWYA